MGLDMYMYKCRKLKEEEVQNLMNGNIQDFEEQYTFFKKDEFEGYETSFAEDLLPVLTNVKVKAKYVNIRKILKDFNIPENVDIVGEGYSGQEVEYTFANNKGFRKEVKLNYDILEEKYVYEAEDEYFVCEMTEVAYWGKAYDIQKFMHKMIKVPIINCGYYHVSEPILSKLIKKKVIGNDEVYYTEEDFQCKGDEIIVYHEWY